MNILGLCALDRNLAALRTSSPAAAAAIEAATARPDLQWLDTDDGVPSATIADLDPLGLAPVQRALASRRRPIEEARRLCETVKVAEAAVFVVLGFGLGYHVEALARRLGRTGILIVFEPDVALLRAVLERTEMAHWLSAANVVILTEADDAAAMAQALAGHEAAVALGLRIVEHPPSRPRIAEQGRAFVARLTDIVRAARTTVVTTMVQTRTTLRNLTQNIDHYALGPGIEDLRGVVAGRAAVVVSAGPSLERNVDLLARPGVRDRIVIVAVQTVLKPLLARGIRPHFVTALDYHEVSARFYEGLTPADVDGVTLVVEPKVNPAVTSAFPGVIRCAADGFLDAVLGSTLSRPMGEIQPGATVAHLAYYLARFLGCDPVALIGQDLGFTDGQYYSAGAAIHNAWAGELNDFNTLEMLEWQRIARHRHLLRKAFDHRGRPLYTDEQMATYLVQFQRDFLADAQRGLTTIDATEGGVAKLHAAPMSLEDFLSRHAQGRPLALPAGAPSAAGPGSLSRRRALAERLRAVRSDVERVASLSRQAALVLSEMREHHHDQPRVNRLIAKIESLRDRVTGLNPAFDLVQRMNQTGAFNRTRADRAINIESAADPLTRQRLQIDRDIANVDALAESADALVSLIDDSARAVAGGPKRTRDAIAAEPAADGRSARPAAMRTVHAVVHLDALGGWRRDVAGVPALHHTLARLARACRLSGVLLLGTEGDAAESRAIAAAARLPWPVDGEFTGHTDTSHGRALAAARAAAPDCWRGALGNLTCYDECFDPRTLAPIMARRALDAALILSGSWFCIDPALCDAVIDRYHEDPAGHRLTFTAAAPGLAPALLDRAVMADLARNREGAGAFASIGGMLAYTPIAPMADLITRSVCVAVDPMVRDCPIAVTADDPARLPALLGALEACPDWRAADAAIVARALASAANNDPAALAGPRPRFLTLPAGLHATLAGADLRGTLVTLIGHASTEWAAPVRTCRNVGAQTVHVRVADGLPRDADGAVTADIVSVSLTAEASPETFRAGVEGLLSRRTIDPASGLPTPWIVPRMERRDAALPRVEPFVDHWLMFAGAAVIDPPTVPDRIRPFPLPALARQRLAMSRLVVNADGGCSVDPFGGGPALGQLGSSPLETLWRDIIAARTMGRTQ